MKLVAVSQRVDSIGHYGEYRDALDQRLGAFLVAAGYLPVPIPNVLCDGGTEDEGAACALDIWMKAVRPAGILFSGGNDIGERPERDATELRLLGLAATLGLPVLGICRGMQMLGHWAGTELVPVAGHVASRHRVSGLIEGEVNSFHQLALAACPQEFEILARSADGCIEAIRHTMLPWEGWMWHPEREERLNPTDLLRLKALLQ